MKNRDPNASTAIGKDNNRASGRAAFDAHGSCWEWQTSTGVFERHVTDDQLAALCSADLQLAPDLPLPSAGSWIYDSRPASHVRAARSERTAAPRSFWQRLRRA